ncbi:MAG: hypothetical protein QG594_1245 [Bacteroidota bacterium]|nr:hypothetical protein [Bacteroidota bacterium]
MIIISEICQYFYFRNSKNEYSKQIKKKAQKLFVYNIIINR